MKGALYWMGVGRARVGGYVNAEGEFRIALQGELDPQYLDDFIRVPNVVKGSLLGGHQIEKEMERTGPLHEQGILWRDDC